MTTEIITVLAIIAAIALMTYVGIADRKRRKRDGAGARSALSGSIGTFDEAFHPSAARAAKIREVQQVMPAESPAPGEPLGRPASSRPPTNTGADE